MIIDSLSNSSRYYSLHHRFRQVFEHLATIDPAELPKGKNEVDGDYIFLMNIDAEGRPREEADLELHRQYIDIQIPLDAADRIGWKAKKDIGASKAAYDPTTDLEFFEGEPDAWIDVQPGTFVIFFTDDGHMPQVMDRNIRKLVYKVAV